MIEAFLIGLVLATIPGYWFKKKVYVTGNEILVSNNLLGIEKISVNGELVVSKFSWAGTHRIEVENNEYEISFFHRRHFLSVGIEVKLGNEIVYTER